MTEVKLGTIHGYPIVGVFELPLSEGTRPSRVILVDRGPESPERWVVSFHSERDANWGQGHYLAEFGEAMASFVRHIKHGTEWL